MNYLALINNDAVLATDWATKCLGTFERISKAAAVGGRAYDWNDELGSKAFSTSNGFYSYQVVDIHRAETATLRTGETESNVDAISGAAVMIKRQAVDKVGYFDNRFFAYYEETDLFARMKRAGYREIIYNPTIHVWHKVAASTENKVGFYLYYMYRNRFIFAVKNFDSLSPFIFVYTQEYLKSIISMFKSLIRKRDHSQQLAFL